MSSADFAVVSLWPTLIAKPSTFPPGAHTHALDDLQQTGANPNDVPMYVKGKWTPVDLRKTLFANFNEDIQIIKDATQSSITTTRTLEVEINNATALLTQKLTVLTDSTHALVESDEQLQIGYNKNTVAIQRIAQAVADANSSTGTIINQIRAQLSSEDGKIQGLSTASTKLTSGVRKLGNQVTAFAQSILVLDSRITDLDTGITGFATAIDTLNTEVTSIDGTLTSYGSRLTDLEAGITGGTDALDARITHLETTYVDTSTFTALSTSVTTLTSTVTSNNTTLSALISSNDSASVSRDTALGVRIDTISASIGAHTFFDATAPTAIALGDLWYDATNGYKVHQWDGTTWVDISDGRIVANAAAVVIVSSALATAAGFLSGQYALNVISGNVVTGMNITSSTSSSGGTTSSIIFQAGVVKFQSGASNIDALLAGGAAADVNANVTTISGGQITANTVTASKLNVTSLDAITANLGTMTGGTIAINTGSTSQGLILSDGHIRFGRLDMTTSVSGTDGTQATFAAGDGSYLTISAINSAVPATLTMGTTSGGQAVLLSADNATASTFSKISVSTFLASTSTLTSATITHLTVSGSINAADFASNHIDTGGIEMSYLDVGDRPCGIDMHSSDGVDYSFRLFRAAGVNGSAEIVQTGTGRCNITAPGGLWVNGIFIA